MPGFDRTGPRGEGPRTGWAAGRCKPLSEKAEKSKDRDTSGNEATPEENLPGGYGRGRGWGPGKGMGRGPGRGAGRGGFRWRGGSR